MEEFQREKRLVNSYHNKKNIGLIYLILTIVVIAHWYIHVRATDLPSLTILPPISGLLGGLIGLFIHLPQHRQVPLEVYITDHHLTMTFWDHEKDHSWNDISDITFKKRYWRYMGLVTLNNGGSFYLRKVKEDVKQELEEMLPPPNQ